MPRETPDEELYRPNVVYIHAHDLGRHLGCYGRDVDTPNIDAFAEESLRFENYFAAAPQCCPSRASAMTGMHTHNHGLMGLTHRGWELNEEVRALPSYFRDAGYETHQFGLQHVSSSSTRLGYEEIHGPTPPQTPSKRALDVADRFETDIDEVFAGERPVFATLGFHEPHHPLQRDYVPEEATERYDPASVTVPGFLPDTDDVREELAAYQALITGVVDPAVGRMVETIDGADVGDETLVVFTTDHGIPFPGAKTNGTDAGLELTLLMRHPALESGARHDELLSNVDILPTLLGLAGEATPATIDGRSFAPLLTGEAYEPRERIFAQQTWHGGILTPFRAIRTREFKYIQNYMTRARGKGGVDHFPEEECYDLTVDPYEQDNLASDRMFGEGFPVNDIPWQDDAAGPNSDYVDDVTALRSRLHEWMVETDDPFVDGDVPMPTHDYGRIRR